MTDITTKLRGMMVWNATANEAADEIDRLRAANRYLIDMHDAVIDDARKYTAAQAEIARLREALGSVVEAADTAPPINVIAYISRAVEKARAALAQAAEVGNG